ncbi:PAAR domain-containing protein [Serratia microhaemolytica]|uniref:PAAR domain-containing protein n=1 Tax=Serratia microhaemolytica TaxID=2675110 RepID=UPI000FDEAA11|nr:PAAR domain-containing protein [Serratia microhaemolytica]
MLNNNVIVKGDITSHGGEVLEGCDDIQVEGIPVALIGHRVSCPRCEGTFLIEAGGATLQVNGRPVALEGMHTSCGAQLLARKKSLNARS